MPDEATPDTTTTREEELVEFTGEETAADLQALTTEAVYKMALSVVRRVGLDSEILNDPNSFIQEIVYEFSQRLRLPGNATKEFEDNVWGSFLEAAASEIILFDVMSNVQVIKDGIGMINAQDETAANLIQSAADPVMLFNGQFTHTAHDLHINGAGIDFNFTRSYKNQVLYKGPLGYNWDHSYNLWLRVSEDQKTIVRSAGTLREDAYIHHEIFDYWMAPDGEDSIIFQEGDRFIARMPDGTMLIYEPQPEGPTNIQFISRIEDRFGNYIKFTYQDGRLRTAEVNHPRRLVEFAYDDLGRLTLLSDFTGRVWRYRYDDFDDLVAVSTPATSQYSEGLTVSFEYSSAAFTGELQHNLTRIIDADGRLYLENEYGTESGVLGFNRVVRQRQGGGETFFEYEDVIQEFEFDYRDTERPAHQTNVVDRNGHIIHYIYNKSGNLLLREEYLFAEGVPKLFRSRYRYNRDGNLVAAMSAEGVITQYLYGREYFIRSRQIEDESDLIRSTDMTAQERQGFTRLLATVRRARYFDLQDLNVAGGVWGDLFPDIFGAFEPDPHDRVKDIIVKFTYEPIYGLLLTRSDARFTISPDPDKQTPAEGEHERHAETLTRYQYDATSTNTHGEPMLFLVRIERPVPTRPDGNPGDEVVEKFTQPEPNDATQEVAA
jgi:YD repeat-containing protein